jgi:hypothetical protein
MPPLTRRKFFKATAVGDKGSLFVFRGGIVTTPKELMKGVEMPKIGGLQSN